MLHYLSYGPTIRGWLEVPLGFGEALRGFQKIVGHSMGGFAAASATAREPNVFAVALISAANLGPTSARQRAKGPHEFFERWHDNASRLVGTSAEDLVKEIQRNPSEWDCMHYVQSLKDRPVLVLEADDRNTAENQALAEALRKAGDARVTGQHLHTDHPFSDHRIALQAAIVNWLNSITKSQP
jgi:pimeloyl-ACP methyl ester carboxylesterase